QRAGLDEAAVDGGEQDWRLAEEPAAVLLGERERRAAGRHDEVDRLVAERAAQVVEDGGLRLRAAAAHRLQRDLDEVDRIGRRAGQRGTEQSREGVMRELPLV